MSFFPIISQLTSAGLTFLQGTSAAEANPLTFSSQNLGAASADRFLICCVGNRLGGTPSGVTINGVTATQLESADRINGADSCSSSIWGASSASGTSGDIVITGLTAGNTCFISLYSATRLQSTTPTDTVASTGNSGTQSGNLDVLSGGFIITCARFRSGTSGNVTIGGVSCEDYEGATFRSGSRSALQAATNVTATITGSADGALCAVSFR